MQLTSILKPLKDWTITGEYSYLQNDYRYSSYPGVLTYADVQLAVKTSPTDPTKDTYTKSRSTTKRNVFNLYSNYAFSLGKNSFTVMGGYNQESYYYESFAGSIQGQTVITVPSFGGGTGTKTLSESYSAYSSRSGFGRLTYNYDNRYLVTLNGRYDGSSKFPKSTRFGFFPSGSVAWRMSQEKFMAPTSNWLSDLKIRASYGSIGNQNIDPYGYVASMSIAQSTTWLDGDDKITTISTPGLVRANYTWETVKTFDVGFDLGVLDNRLTAIFDWYRRSTEDMLSDGAELPSTVGASAPKQNVANMRTDGWELSVNWQDRINDWTYRIGFNLFDYKEKITKFNNATGSLDNWSEGYSIGSIWGYVSDGYYTIDDFDLEKAKAGVWVLKDGVPSINGYNVRPGDCKFVDLDGNGVINTGASTVSDPGDRKVIGNNLPRYQFGANLGLSWKGLDLDVQLQGVGKRDYVLGGTALYPFGGSGADGVFYPLYYNQTDYWTALSYDPADPNYMVAANPNAKLFRIYGQEQNIGSNTRTSTAYLQSAAYMRVKNVTLAYNFPAKILKPISVNGLRVYVSVENLATITSLPKGYDPENLSWAYPFYRTWSVGASLTF
jgi:TonB-linked SusC/RagA family outer membrane protein